MPLESIKSAENCLKLSPKDFKSLAEDCRKGKKKVVRMISGKRRAIEKLESRKRMKPTEKRQHQELCARIIELGNEESSYDLQQAELAKAIKAWFI